MDGTFPLTITKDLAILGRRTIRRHVWGIYLVVITLSGLLGLAAISQGRTTPLNWALVIIAVPVLLLWLVHVASDLAHRMARWPDLPVSIMVRASSHGIETWKAEEAPSDEPPEPILFIIRSRNLWVVGVPGAILPIPFDAMNAETRRDLVSAARASGGRVS